MGDEKIDDTSPPFKSNKSNRNISDLHDRSLYTTLELDQGATLEEIRRSYRRLALKHHPDKNLGDSNAAERFKEINYAHSILSDPNKRTIYDSFGSLGLVLLENSGNRFERTLVTMSHPAFKYIFLITFCISGCCCCLCCCFCCNFCCGRCAPSDDKNRDDEVLLITEEEISLKDKNSNAPPVVSQPKKRFSK